MQPAQTSLQDSATVSQRKEANLTSTRQQGTRGSPIVSVNDSPLVPRVAVSPSSALPCSVLFTPVTTCSGPLSASTPATTATVNTLSLPSLQGFPGASTSLSNHSGVSTNLHPGLSNNWSAVRVAATPPVWTVTSPAMSWTGRTPRTVLSDGTLPAHGCSSSQRGSGAGPLDTPPASPTLTTAAGCDGPQRTGPPGLALLSLPRPTTTTTTNVSRRGSGDTASPTLPDPRLTSAELRISADPMDSNNDENDNGDDDDDDDEVAHSMSYVLRVEPDRDTYAKCGLQMTLPLAESVPTADDAAAIITTLTPSARDVGGDTKAASLLSAPESLAHHVEVTPAPPPTLSPSASSLSSALPTPRRTPVHTLQPSALTHPTHLHNSSSSSTGSSGSAGTKARQRSVVGGWVNEEAVHSREHDGLVGSCGGAPRMLDRAVPPVGLLGERQASAGEEDGEDVIVASAASTPSPDDGGGDDGASLSSSMGSETGVNALYYRILGAKHFAESIRRDHPLYSSAPTPSSAKAPAVVTSPTNVLLTGSRDMSDVCAGLDTRNGFYVFSYEDDYESERSSEMATPRPGHTPRPRGDTAATTSLSRTGESLGTDAAALAWPGPDQALWTTSTSGGRRISGTSSGGRRSPGITRASPHTSLASSPNNTITESRFLASLAALGQGGAGNPGVSPPITTATTPTYLASPVSSLGANGPLEEGKRFFSPASLPPPPEASAAQQHSPTSPSLISLVSSFPGSHVKGAGVVFPGFSSLKGSALSASASGSYGGGGNSPGPQKHVTFDLKKAPEKGTAVAEVQVLQQPPPPPAPSSATVTHAPPPRRRASRKAALLSSSSSLNAVTAGAASTPEVGPSGQPLQRFSKLRTRSRVVQVGAAADDAAESPTAKEVDGEEAPRGGAARRASGKPTIIEVEELPGPVLIQAHVARATAGTAMTGPDVGPQLSRTPLSVGNVSLARGPRVAKKDPLACDSESEEEKDNDDATLAAAGPLPVAPLEAPTATGPRIISLAELRARIASPVQQQPQQQQQQQQHRASAPVVHTHAIVASRTRTPSSAGSSEGHGHGAPTSANAAHLLSLSQSRVNNFLKEPTPVSATQSSTPVANPAPPRLPSFFTAAVATPTAETEGGCVREEGDVSSMSGPLNAVPSDDVPHADRRSGTPIPTVTPESKGNALGTPHVRVIPVEELMDSLRRSGPASQSEGRVGSGTTTCSSSSSSFGMAVPFQQDADTHTSDEVA